MCIQKWSWQKSNIAHVLMSEVVLQDQGALTSISNSRDANVLTASLPFGCRGLVVDGILEENLHIRAISRMTSICLGMTRRCKIECSASDVKRSLLL